MKQRSAANDNQSRPQWFDDLLLAHRPYILSRIGILERDANKREDLCQEVMTCALDRWCSFRPEGKFAGWLYWIVFETVHKKDKSAARGPILRPVEPAQEYYTDVSLAIERTGERAAEVMLSAVGHSEEDIAARFGVSGPTIHYRIKRARQRLAANDNNKVARSA